MYEALHTSVCIYIAGLSVCVRARVDKKEDRKAQGVRVCVFIYL